MSSDLKQAILDQAKTLASEMDQRLIDFFGSEEMIKTYGHMYVLEEQHTRVETCMQSEFTGDYFKLRAETTYRIRPKTLAEMEAEGINV